MNRNEFENSMKSKLQEQQFVPREDMWLCLQADLQQKPPAKKNLIFLAPLKIAAGVLLAAFGTMTVYLINNNKGTTNTQVITVNKTITSSQPKEIPQPQNEPETIIAVTINPGKAIAAQKTANTKQQINKDVKAIEKIVPGIASTPATAQSNHTIPVAGNEHMNDDPGPRLQPEERNNFYADNNTYNPKPVNVGLLANVGSSTVSNVSYQVGVMGRGDLSKTVFVEAGLTLASNTVSNSNRYSFPGVSMSNDGFQNSSEKNNTNIKADYARNIISVGFTPAVGIRATKRLSFTTGAALNRNLNPTLTLTNENDIESAALTNNIISTSQKVANWDIGLTCAAGYKVTRQLSLNVNYRKGLTNYLQQDNKQLKNSGVQLGLKFIFGKQ
ncbi:PorT family protein [Taibaiella lutea]|uniref:PorT family protein n=1 Tax=Taibaiella lutea TaxID=2608001 RepID=A0A5M6CRE9_9BACT|nr:outer membrane beta-barrel protein [Taibaiella lutea]KAA5536950.1 PorT family protein [Taibaiella lutea]